MEKDLISVAGLLNVEIKYTIYPSREAADEARERGEFLTENLMGKISHVVAWEEAEGEVLVLHRKFPQENTQAYYRASLDETSLTMCMDVEFVTSDNRSAKSHEKFNRVNDQQK